MAIRRHWPWMTAIPVIVLSILLALIQRGSDSEKARAQESGSSGATSLSAPTAESELAKRAYLRSQSLMQELVLTNQDLAAMGLSSETAQQVFGLIKTLASTDPYPLAASTAVELSARHNLAEAMRKVNVGPRDETVLASLPTLKQNVQAALAQKQAVLSGIVAQFNAMLTADQQAVWQAARSNAGRGIPGAYKYAPGLTDAQVVQLDRAARRGGGPGLLAATPQILTSAQLSQAQAATTNQRVAAARVAVAGNQIIPIPAELLPPPPTTTIPAGN